VRKEKADALSSATGPLPAAHAPLVLAFLEEVLQRDPARRLSVEQVTTSFEAMRAHIIGDAEPRQPTSADDDQSAGQPSKPPAGPAVWPSPLAGVATPQNGPASLLTGLAAGCAGSGLAGVVPLSSHLLLAPRAALRVTSLIHALRVGLVVCVGVEPPVRQGGAARGAAAAAAAVGVETVVLHRLADAESVSTAAASLAARVAQCAAAGRATLVVGDAQYEGCCPLAAALLQLSAEAGAAPEEGPPVSPFEVAMRLRDTCPLAAGRPAGLATIK